MEDTAPSGPSNALELARAAARIADDRKGQDILLLDARDVCSITDYLLIVVGNSPPHLKALFGEIQVQLKQAGHPVYRRSGVPEGGWMVLDYVDVVIHILSPEAREYYAIETLWAAAPHLQW